MLDNVDSTQSLCTGIEYGCEFKALVSFSFLILIYSSSRRRALYQNCDVETWLPGIAPQERDTFDVGFWGIDPYKGESAGEKVASF